MEKFLDCVTSENSWLLSLYPRTCSSRGSDQSRSQNGPVSGGSVKRLTSLRSLIFLTFGPAEKREMYTILQNNFLSDTILKNNFLWHAILQNNFLWDAILQNNFLSDANNALWDAILHSLDTLLDTVLPLIDQLIIYGTQYAIYVMLGNKFQESVLVSSGRLIDLYHIWQ